MGITQKLIERDLMEKIIEKNKNQQQQASFEQNLPQQQEIVEKNQPEEDMNYLRREASVVRVVAPARAGSSQGPLSLSNALRKQCESLRKTNNNERLDYALTS